MDTKRSRRTFLEDAAVAGLGLGVGLLTPWDVWAQCAPPGMPGTPTPWKGDYRAILPRKPASTLTAPEVTVLKKAYGEMRKLAMATPTDPRGWQHQANVHCWNCGGGGDQVHFRWKFFAWHRAQLYFHERILGQLIGDPNFRLPYWSWDNPAHRKLPPPYVTPNDASNPLFNATRGATPADALEEWVVGASVISNLMALNSFSSFGGGANSSGSAESGPHGGVHVFVDGDMGGFFTAGNDPVFYAHHSRVDKLWSDWNKASASHTNPGDPAFLNLTFTFFDENKVWTSMKASDMLDHENTLRYTYAEPLKLKIDLSKFKYFKIELKPEPDPRFIRIDPKVRDMVKRAVAQGQQLALHLEELDVERRMTGIYRIYASPEEAQKDAGPDSPGYLGYVALVPNSVKDPAAGPTGRPSVVLEATRSLSTVLGQRDQVQLSMVQHVKRARVGAVRRPIPVRARSIYLMLR